ncbi:hypothetical protein M422DRAFT_784789 [Sphaerobolus stellatus SS14]|uniref:Ketoreductase domain-containing protein n=1 Tax=Sphaerobolus stellatus (strain SS14) TaxID=990650 RepID=A0A0C9UQJ4_SPHS4|nr:hypothetical protein M422DRAFT_784789 [Sphaerobolus stellatus SS14]
MMRFDIILVDDAGERLCTLSGVEVAKHMLYASADTSQPFEVVLQPSGCNSSITGVSADFILNGVNESFSRLDDHTEDELLTRTEEIHSQGIERVLPVIDLPIADSYSYLPKLFEALEHEVSLHFEIFTNAILSVEGPRHMIRSVTLEAITAGTSNIKSNFFDIAVISSDLSSTSDDVNFVVEACQLLSHGGSLILTSCRQDRMDIYSKLTKSCDIQVLQISSQDAKKSLFIIEGKKKSCQSQHEVDRVDQSLWSFADPFVYEYIRGEESQLQWEFSGLNVLQELEIWITATTGPDASAAFGLVRSLRRENKSWTIRLIEFPDFYSEDQRESSLEALPPCLQDELDIVISKSGAIQVPRIVPLPPIPASSCQIQGLTSEQLLQNHALVDIHSFSIQGSMLGFLGSIRAASTPLFNIGTMVAGLMGKEKLSAGPVDMDALTLCPVSLLSSLPQEAIPAVLPGLVTAILAPGIGIFNSVSHQPHYRILLTHADSLMGQSIQGVYAHTGITVHTVSQKATILQLAHDYEDSYDLILSGYIDLNFIQILKRRLSPRRGKLYLWNDHDTGLLNDLITEPWSLTEAYKLLQSMTKLGKQAPSLDDALRETEKVQEKMPEISNVPRPLSAQFDEQKWYILLGGIGTIGIHIALLMYERGARRIVLTSRSGEASLLRSSNKVLLMMYHHLRSLPGLDFRLEAVDATSLPAMKGLCEPLQPNLGGCFILSAVLADRVFQHLNEEEFKGVYAAKLGVLDTLKATVDISRLDFVIAFSSISGLFGTQGQTNYAAANTALEEETSKLDNGFSFISPGILDSTLMLAGVSVTEKSLDHFTEWSLPAEEMIKWLEDAIVRFQHGQRIPRYLPGLDWATLDRTHGMPLLGTHLVPSQTIAESQSINKGDAIAAIVKSVLKIPDEDFSPEIPLTAYGIDSLSASRISFLLKSILEVSQIQLLADISINVLLNMVAAEPQIVETERAIDKPTMTLRLTNDRRLQALATKYIERLVKGASECSKASITVDEEIFLITGTTDGLGANIVAQLLDSPFIKRVYALNRTNEPNGTLQECQKDVFERHGLSGLHISSSKLVLLEGDLTEEYFGLPKEIFEEIQSSVTSIIHNAWTIDFSKPLMFFEKDIDAQSEYIKRILDYPSNLDGPEAPIVDAKVPVQIGYMESKWVGERLFDAAVDKLGLRANVIRVGLVSGGLNGAWDVSHWLPAIVQSGTFLGCLPDGAGLASWIPVQVAAAAIIEMQGAPHHTLHLIHPRPVRWSIVMGEIANLLQVPLVPHLEWFARLDHAMRHADDSKKSRSQKARFAALTFVEFYKLGLKKDAKNAESMGLMPNVGVAEALKASKTLRAEQLPSIGSEDVRRWIDYWRRIDLL